MSDPVSPTREARPITAEDVVMRFIGETVVQVAFDRDAMCWRLGDGTTVVMVPSGYVDWYVRDV